jgi:two-component sensor histidine kinase/PAS domain-containing protein
MTGTYWSKPGWRFLEAEKTMDSAVQELENLTQDEIAFLKRLEQDLPFLADLSQADVSMYCLRPSGEAVVIAQAWPRSILPLHIGTLIGQQITAADEPAVFYTLMEGRKSGGQRLLPGRDVSVFQEVYPIWAADERVLAAVSIETSLFEWERHRRRSKVFRQALELVQQMVLAGALRGLQHLTPIGEHDGLLVIDTQHRIQYVSVVAANLYRKIGYSGELEKKCIEDLDIDDNSLVLEVLNKGECLEVEVKAQDRIWVKKGIPLFSTSRRWPRLLPSQNGRRPLEGVLLIVSDVTDQRRQEEELQIKVTMIREIHHRVKNNLQTIASLLRMQARRSDSEQIRRALNESVSRILSMAVIHEFLAHQDARVINIRDVSQRIIAQFSEGVLDPQKKIRLELSGSNIYLPTQQATACALVINELVQNAVEHGYGHRKSGRVAVDLQDDGTEVTISVDDDGVGLPEAFDMAQTGSLGLQIVQSLVQSDLKGNFELNSRDNGVSAVVTFPKQAQGGL